jgi:hypothetical protein
MATQPSSVEQITSNIPSWMVKYADPLLGQIFGAQDPATGKFVPGLIGMGYQPYMVPKRDEKGNIIKDDKGQPVFEPGQRIAEFTELQKAAFDALAGKIDPKTGQPIVSPELTQAADIARGAGADASRLSQYTSATERNFYDSPAFREMQTQFERVGAAPSTQYQMGPAERVGAERFGLGSMREYMSPYMEGVVEAQKRGAVSDYMRQLPGMGAAAARAGAKGGTREALMQSEARRGLAERLGDIEAQGLQQAYQQAAGQFGQDRAAMMQAALANQQAGLTTGQQNLQALINQSQFGAGQGLQAQQLNQAAQLQNQQQALAQLAQANQFAQQNAQQRAQYGLAGANLAEQSRQFGAGLGLQGLQQRLAAAGALGGLGQQRYGQEMGINQALLGAGGQQQAFNQQLLNTGYQDFINQQMFPYKQAEFAMGILRGLPTDASRSFYTQPGNLFAQYAGMAGGVGSLFGGLGQAQPT